MSHKLIIPDQLNTKKTQKTITEHLGCPLKENKEADDPLVIQTILPFDPSSTEMNVVDSNFNNGKQPKWVRRTLLIITVMIALLHAAIFVIIVYSDGIDSVSDVFSTVLSFWLIVVAPSFLLYCYYKTYRGST